MNKERSGYVIKLEMKTSALSLILLVSAVQTVGWVECCCVLFCKHHNDPCSDCKDQPQPAPEKDCCKKKKAAQHSRHTQGDGRCAHVEPSSEVNVHSAEQPPMTMDVVAELPVAAPLPAPVFGEERLIELDRVRGSPPLLLLCSVLQI